MLFGNPPPELIISFGFIELIITSPFGLIIWFCEFVGAPPELNMRICNYCIAII